MRGSRLSGKNCLMKPGQKPVVGGTGRDQRGNLLGRKAYLETRMLGYHVSKAGRKRKRVAKNRLRNGDREKHPYRGKLLKFWKIESGIGNKEGRCTVGESKKSSKTTCIGMRPGRRKEGNACHVDLELQKTRHSYSLGADGKPGRVKPNLEPKG